MPVYLTNVTIMACISNRSSEIGFTQNIARTPIPQLGKRHWLKADVDTNPLQTKVSKVAVETFEHLGHTYVAQKNRVLGQGVYGLVLSGIDESTQEPVALKITPKSPKGHRFKAAQNEANMLLQAQNIEHVVKLRDAFEQDNQYITVLEQVPVENIHRKYFRNLKRSDLPNISFQEVIQIGKQMLEALHHLHVEPRILHADLKPDNLCWNPDTQNLKVFDFGLSTSLPSEGGLLGGTVQAFQYRAPEVLMKLGFNEKADIWSVGCILYELCTGKRLFDFNHYNPSLNDIDALNNNSELHDLYQIQCVMKELGNPPIRARSKARANWFERDPVLNNYRLKSSPPFLSQCVAGAWKEKLRLVALRNQWDTSRMEQLIDCMESLLKYDPKERLSAEQALHSTCFSNQIFIPATPTPPPSDSESIDSLFFSSDDEAVSLQSVVGASPLAPPPIQISSNSSLSVQPGSSSFLSV